jgi:hypothetical protein
LTAGNAPFAELVAKATRRTTAPTDHLTREQIDEPFPWIAAGAAWAWRKDYDQLKTLQLDYADDELGADYTADNLRGKWVDEGMIACMGLDPDGLGNQRLMKALSAASLRRGRNARPSWPREGPNNGRSPNASRLSNCRSTRERSGRR